MEEDYLDRLIQAGYGDVDQPEIPAEIMAAAREGRPIPRLGGEFKPRGARIEPRKHCCMKCTSLFESTAAMRVVKYCPACRKKAYAAGALARKRRNGNKWQIREDRVQREALHA